MDRHLFIVSQDQADLWAHLRREFSTEEIVDVILDRREGPDRRSGRDRRAAGRGLQDRRAADRRARPFIDTQLRSLGYAMLRVG